MKYRCYWVAPDGREMFEASFRKTREDVKTLSLERVESAEGAVFPFVRNLVLPKICSREMTKLVSNPHYWGDVIQVNLGDFGFPFIFEPVKE